MKNKKYKIIWLGFVNIKAKDGTNFNDLIDLESSASPIYIGAWGNILVKSESIPESIHVLELGLAELGFQVEFIDKIENFMSLVEANEVNIDIIKEADWLLKSNFVFKISDRLFPYDSVR